METFLLLVVLIVSAVNVWFITRVIDEQRETRNQLLRMVGTTQSRLKTQVRSNPYPAMPQPKAEQHYEGQGVPRPKPGSVPREVTASNTPVRIGKVARRRVGGPDSDASNRGLQKDQG